MGLEDLTGAAKYIDDLVTTFPDDDDDLGLQGAHTRGVKNVLANSFPNVTGIVTASHTELSFLAGATTFVETFLGAQDPAPALKAIANPATTQTVNYTTVANDHGSVVEMNGASLTLTLLAPATATVGYKVGVKNIHTSDLLVNVSGGGTIDGGASITMKENECFFFEVNNSAAEYMRTSDIIPTTTSSLMVMATGTYNGNDAELPGGQSIELLGFQPRFILITEQRTAGGTASHAWWTTDSIVDNHANGLCYQIVRGQGSDNHSSQTGEIVSLDADGFTVAGSVVGAPNNSGQTYEYVAYGDKTIRHLV